MALAVLLSDGSALAQTVAAFDTKAKQAYMIEATTGTVLFAKAEDEIIPPASLAKLMTAEYVFNELASGRIADETLYKVSEYAWRTGGALSRTSTMFAALNSQIRVIDLLQGLAVQSANDACIILAEGLEGSEAAFAAKLTERARLLGLQKSVFANSNGLPNPENKTTVREMVLLAQQIEAKYPKYFPLFAQKDFEWNKIFQRNRNPLLALNIGVDGMALGFAENSGYAIVTTVERDGRRLFLALAGLKTDKERTEEARRVLEWGLTSFASRTVFKADEVIAEAPVFGGDRSHVPLKAGSSVDIFIPVDNPDRIRARIAYKWPLKAPVTAGQEIGILSVSVGERRVREVPVHAAADVGVGTLTSKALDGLKELLFFWL
ncbi:D-alanyl-D-alanine carboxypeptidase family protein [Rhizobium alvei]|uniref:serine-type D-Ala-D-Ala carboxypeptidase n=1 Tax=Rhizobium alvei TaxID=1132659 RepID=A0ABT8YKD1_9HYPH|nr:D-alanyl-D-alanine carboxypeptidase family protein [Rhizobium alvei]MDO6964097.1 D-alanyl-D-alanine carboxypeptidase family protein [Rhizobium alvei]